MISDAMVSPGVVQGMASVATAPPSMRPLVVLPTHDEAENIVWVLEALRDAVPVADVLVVDDAGTDDTAAVAEQAAARLGRIEVLRRPEKAGLGTAYLTGFAVAVERGYRAVVEMDSDRSHDPRALVALLAELDAGADLAIGSRYVPGGSIPRWAAYRRALSSLGNRVATAALGTHVGDLTSGFRAYRLEALKRADLSGVRSEGYGFQIEMAARVMRAGAKVVEVPITFHDRTRGASKLSGRIVVEALVLCASLWWQLNRPRARSSAPRPAAARSWRRPV
ncbi:MAG: polyprenol monophosphomannose synthase [Actinomycetota bacterium]|nr:polyprenol monophosphomannose synthase [Actinomycetota bacterium]